MLRPLLISSIIAICLVSQGNISCAQERSVGPYFGLSGSLGGSLDTRSPDNTSAGWGIEGGIHFRTFYAGLEYGTYANLFQTVDVTLHVRGSISPPAPVSGDQFWGVHAGYVFNNSIYVGFVVLNSYQPWERWDSVSGWITFTKSYLNIGPDFRYSGIDDGHIYLAFAFTIRRGFKAGLGYMF